VGHTVIDRLAWLEGRPCTLEELGSGSGVARQAREVGLGSLSAREVAVARAHGDRRAVEVWDVALAACAIGVSNLVMAFSPSAVVIGGGLGLQPEFFEPLVTLARSRPEHFPADLIIVSSDLADDAGLAGAAAWVSATRD
jgi:predicted NBD/HSP70 family sugar kinase